MLRKAPVLGWSLVALAVAAAVLVVGRCDVDQAVRTAEPANTSVNETDARPE